MDYTTFSLALLFIPFLAVYTILRNYSRTAMMMYVICFSLFIAYQVNGTMMWLLPLTACINYAITQRGSLLITFLSFCMFWRA